MDPSYSGIYQILHAADGRVYVGSAVHIGKRWGLHRRRLNAGTHHSAKLQNAWNKYGSDAFRFEVLERVDDRDLLLKREQAWLDQTKAARDGFNVLPTAGSLLGHRLSDASKQRMSQAHAGRSKTPEHAAKVADALRGRKMTDEQRQKMSEAKKGKTRKPHTAETKARMSAAAKGKAKSPEHRAALANAIRGRKHSEETRARMSSSHRARRSQPTPTI